MWLDFADSGGSPARFGACLLTITVYAYGLEVHSLIRSVLSPFVWVN